MTQLRSGQPWKPDFELKDFVLRFEMNNENTPRMGLKEKRGDSTTTEKNLR